MSLSADNVVVRGGKDQCTVGGSVFDRECWFQCSNPECRKWRCVEKASADVLRGRDFRRPKATDMDWELWLRDAAARFARLEEFHEVVHAPADDEHDGVQETQDVVASVPNVVADDEQDGVRTPSDAVDGARTPSDWELASEDGDIRGGIEDRAQDSQFVQSDGMAGHVLRGSRQCGDVHPLAKRFAKPYAARVKALLEKEFPSLYRKVRIDSAEVMKLWVGWCEYWEKRSKEKRRARRASVCKRVARSENSLGSVLFCVFARANGCSVNEFIDAELAVDYVFQEALENMEKKRGSATAP